MVMDDCPCPARQGGFTLIEVMVAMLVLLVGVLGTASLLDTALKVGHTSRSREAATNLGREIVEAARSIDYDRLVDSTAPAALQAVDGLQDVDAATDGWQVRRRGVLYTVTVEACIYDDAKDGSFSANTGAGYCPGLPAGSSDANGDDYRKLTVTSAWKSRQVRLTANVVNPAGGFGPRITSVASTPAAGANSIILAGASTTDIHMTVGTTPATSLNWDAGDTKNRGELASASGATSWAFTWPLGTPVEQASYTCATAIDWISDAPAYQMTFQPFDSSGTPGDLRTQTVSIDRSSPYPPCDFAGGRNPQHGSVIDLQWRASFEGDVVSYSVWRTKQGDETADRLICDAVRTTECTDAAPPTQSGAIEYYVKARQDNLALGRVFGAQKGLSIAAVGTPANRPPSEPGDVAIVGGAQPTISWTPSSDSDGTVIFYRIYRDGRAIADRYGKTSNGTTLAFTDKSSGGTSHTYYVSAVDDAFAESPLVQVP